MHILPPKQSMKFTQFGLLVAKFEKECELNILLGSLNDIYVFPL